MKNFNKILSLLLLASFGLATPSFAMQGDGQPSHKNESNDVQNDIKNPNDEESQGYQCPICCDTEQSHTFINLPDKHRFHLKCLSEWLKKNFSCPLCRKQVGIISLLLTKNKTLEAALYKNPTFLPKAFAAVQQNINNKNINIKRIVLILLKRLVQDKYLQAFNSAHTFAKKNLDEDNVDIRVAALDLLDDLVQGEYQPAFKTALVAARENMHNNNVDVRAAALALLDDLVQGKYQPAIDLQKSIQSFISKLIPTKRQLQIISLVMVKILILFLVLQNKPQDKKERYQ